ncbi:MAG TPA: branched-chain amino acid ABC transporter permease [Anaerolineales bacterium]|nr:branched-chain amino acid ABC transporter permease [Anaerolineales bacterium]
MDLFLQQLVSGISIGAIYALLAVGYALVYSIYNFTNWAFDAFMAFGAIMAFVAIASLAMPFWLAAILAIVLTIILAVGTEKLAYKPLRMRKAPRLFMMISAMGVNLTIVQLMNKFFGGTFRKFPVEHVQPIFIGDVSVGRMDLLAGAISFGVLALLWIFLYRSKWGLAIRASSIDIQTASLMGINNDAVAVIIFGLTGILSTVAGVFYGIKYAVFPMMGTITIKAMIASIIGGLGNLPAAIVGSMLLGVLETLVSGYISSAYRDLFSFLFLIVILLFFPNGLMGKSSEEKL